MLDLICQQRAGDQEGLVEDAVGTVKDLIAKTAVKRLDVFHAMAAMTRHPLNATSDSSARRRRRG